MNKKTDKKQAVGDGNPGPGRPPGSPNKIGSTIKMMVIEALERKKGGGVKWLMRQADKHPQAFMTLLGRIIPTQVIGDVSHRYVAEMPPPEKDPEQWLQRYSPPQTHQAPETRQ